MGRLVLFIAEQLAWLRARRLRDASPAADAARSA